MGSRVWRTEGKEDGVEDVAKCDIRNASQHAKKRQSKDCWKHTHTQRQTQQSADTQQDIYMAYSVYTEQSLTLPSTEICAQGQISKLGIQLDNLLNAFAAPLVARSG